MDMVIEVDIGARIGTIAGGTTMVGAGGDTVVTGTTIDKWRCLVLIDVVLLNRLEPGRRQSPWERADSQTDCLARRSSMESGRNSYGSPRQ